MKVIAGIRLVLAAALMVLFSGTMAFAHTGHEHQPGSSHVRYTSQEHSSSSVSLVLRVHISTSIQSGLSSQHDGPVVIATDGQSRQSGVCSSGNCCCCNGASSCGMAGACHASAMPAADQQHIFVSDRNVIPIAVSESVSGSILFGLDRPPKA